MTGRRVAATAVLTLVAVLPLGPGATGAQGATHQKIATSSATTTSSIPSSLPGTSGTVTVKRWNSPARTVVSDNLGVVAVVTDGSRTVTLRGPARVFSESTTTARVSHGTWVRLLPAAFTGSVDWAWLAARLSDISPDVLAVAMQYVTGAPTVLNAAAFKIAGDASYGPLSSTGTRIEGSDFNDYLGVAWSYPGSTDQPEADQINALDCSGFIRMVLGYRSGLPLTLTADGVSLPRRAVQMADSAPGVLVIANKGTRPTDLTGLRPGDLVFFDASTDDGTAIDHVGMYLGTDSAGAPRFVSSRKTVDGPTMGDLGGKSTLTGTGLYSKSLRSARRV